MKRTGHQATPLQGAYDPHKGDVDTCWHCFEDIHHTGRGWLHYLRPAARHAR